MNSESQKPTAHDRVTQMLANFYAMMGNPPDAPGALNMMADALLGAGLTADQVNQGLNRCMVECRFPVRLPDIFQRVPNYQTPEDRQQVEAEAAWEFVNRYLCKWGVVVFPGEHRPALPSRIEYALRRVGGLNGLNQITEQSRPFEFKEFCEGYKQAPVAESMTPQLAALFGDQKLLPTATSPKRLAKPAASHAKPPVAKVKPVPAPPTDADLRDRRMILKQQAEQILKRRERQQEG